MLKPNLTRKLLYNIPLSDFCKSIIYGTILGDGMLKIYDGYANARLSIKHSITQLDYFNWLANSLVEIASDNSVITCKPSQNQKLLFQSRSLKTLTEIYNMTYVNNKLNIKRSWLNHMNEISLMVWWLDDGSIIGNGRRGVFCTDAFNKESIEILKQYLKVVWLIDTSIGLKRGPKNKVYYRLYLNTAELKKLLIIIMPYIPTKSMLYKIELKYKDKEMQQRWISIIKDKIKFKID